MVDVYQNILDRLFSKYRHSPIILKVSEILSDPLQDTNDAIDWILGHMSIDDAEGTLLDALASWIGVKRPPAQETRLFRLCRDEEVAEDPENNHGLAPDDLSSGGSLSADDGCTSKSAPGTYISDAEFRLYIRAKAATFRRVATREVMYDYILQFGIRTKLVEGVRTCEIHPSSYEDFGLAVRYHIEHRGFRPAGIRVSVARQQQSDAEV